jgi:hypothetical protein
MARPRREPGLTTAPCRRASGTQPAAGPVVRRQRLPTMNHPHFASLAASLALASTAATAPADPLAAIDEAAAAGAGWEEFARQAGEGSPVAAAWLGGLAAGGDDVAGRLRAAWPALAAEITARGGSLQHLEAPPEAADATSWARAFGRAALERRRLRLARLAREAPHIVFAKRQPIRPSFILYTEGLSDARAERHFHPGSTLSVLEFDGLAGKVRDLLADPLGMIRDPDVHYDGRHVLFAWKRSADNDDYHLYELDTAGGGVPRQLTFGLGMADYEGAYLPDDSVVFTSSRAEHSVPCWFTEVSNLFKVNRDGSHLRRLAIDQVHAVHPKPAADGRVIFTRWDYNDRGQNYPHGLYQMNPDGTGQAALYGASSWFPTSILHARPVPGSQRLLAIASGHHTPQQGKVVEIDPNRGRDEGAGLRFVAPLREVAYERVDRAMQDGAVFAHPYPLGHDEFIASRAAAAGKDQRFELWWFDYAGAGEWLAGDPTLACLHPVPLRPRPREHLRPDATRPEQDTAVIYVEDVYAGGGLAGVPRGTAKSLRVVELLYRAAGIGQNHNSGKGGGSLSSSPISIANGAWDVKAVVGETPIHPDGSVLVEVPALKSLYFQVLDERGRMVQTMRSWDTLQPGETKSCIGCHAYSRNTTTATERPATLALRAGPAPLTPFFTGWRGFSFPRDVQPVLDAKCLACHDGSDPARLDLRGEPVADPVALRHWSRSYLSLTASHPNNKGEWVGRPDGPWTRWIDKMSQPTPLPPLASGSARSPLLDLAGDAHREVRLDDGEFRRLAAWIDLGVPFCGDYHEAAGWNDTQRATYRYYEDKRRVNDRIQHAERRRRIEGRPAAAWHADQFHPGQVLTVAAGQTSASRPVSPAEWAAGFDLELPAGQPAAGRLAVAGPVAIALSSDAGGERWFHAPDGHWSDPAAAGVLRLRGLTADERGAYRNLAAATSSPDVGLFPVASGQRLDFGRPVRIDRIDWPGGINPPDPRLRLDGRPLPARPAPASPGSWTFPPAEGRILEWTGSAPQPAVWGLDADTTPAARIRTLP